MKMLFIFICVLGILSCDFHHEKKHNVICPKVQKEQGGELYCSIPFVEMQANYNDLDGMLIQAHGVLVLVGGEALLVDPSSGNFDIPQHYNVVALGMAEGEFETLLPLHQKYVSVMGRFDAKYDGDDEWPDAIAHSISDAEVYEAFP